MTPSDHRAMAHLRQRIADDRCILLDGAIATELQRRAPAGFRLSDEEHWGFDALHTAPATVQEVHAAYLAAGADILTTNTYSVLEAPSYTGHYPQHRPAHWMDLARRAVALARAAIRAADREGEVAVAFSIGGDIENEDQRATVELLLRLFADHPPDLLLFETLSMIEDNLTLEIIRELVGRGWPVWVSFRRCRQGVCGIHGQLWGGPEGDRFGRLAQRMERLGVEALLINCLPMARVPGTLSWLRDFTDLPLGVYPNVGRHVGGGWQFDPHLSPRGFAEQALAWRAEGAQIIGGCCGVGPAEIACARERLAAAPRGTEKPPATPAGRDLPADSNHWQDPAGRSLYPLPLPIMTVDPGVFVPTQGSYLIWKFLFQQGVGRGLRCLDVGCGVGILSLQLALNGAAEVTAVDIQPAAIRNTMTNAYRNGVADGITARVQDLYSYTPTQKFDLIVASLYQMPTDPRGRYSGHRDVDYWGRSLLDHFFLELPNYLAADGVAYAMQVSMLGARRTQALLHQVGYSMRVLDFNLYPFNALFHENLEQIERVEKLSDAYHFSFGAHEHVMAMYLLEIRRGEG